MIQGCGITSSTREGAFRVGRSFEIGLLPIEPPLMFVRLFGLFIPVALPYELQLPLVDTSAPPVVEALINLLSSEAFDSLFQPPF